jgi:amino acid adenylation domain-containing protein
MSLFLLVDYLDLWAKTQPDETAFIFLNDEGAESQRITYKDLQENALKIAFSLLKKQCHKERIVLFFQPGLEFIISFLGCLYAGVVAVPIPPPQGKRQSERVKIILADAKIGGILTTQAIKNRITDIESKWIDYDTILTDKLQSFELPKIKKNDTAFLQYTSGSTSTPKGVMISHGNLIANEKIIAEAFGHSKTSVIAGWLPFYHDMGLIGNILQPLYLGVTCVLMSPITFLQNPLIWLKTISKYRVTTSGGPNFAYQLCTTKIHTEDLRSLDLSSWKIAFNGSEPVYKETMDSFAAMFRDCGFDKNVFYPCYGLAEATLFVTGPRANEDNNIAYKDNRVSCGHTRFEERMLIVDPISRIQRLNGQIGEVWVSGDSVAQGYWNMPEHTEHTFHAYTADGLGPFMRTGDLGFIDHANLFITGRSKNVMILRGKNYYPHDIENYLKTSCPDLNGGQFAAISIPHENEEKLVVIYELDRAAVRTKNYANLIQWIKSGLSQEFQLDPHAVILVKPGAIPRTTSGKLQHHLCREKYLEQTFEIINEWNRSTNTSEDSTPLSKILELPAAEISLYRSFSDHGIDSLKAVQIQALFKTLYGKEIAFEQIFENISIQELINAAPEINKSFIEDEIELLQEAPLSPNQLDVWVAHQINPNTTAYHIPVKMHISGQFNIAAFKEAWHLLMRRHTILRTIIRTINGTPQQFVLTEYKPPLEVYDIIDISIEKCYQDLVDTPFELDQGPLFRLVIIKNFNEYEFLCNFHHLICDGWSMNILAQELALLYEAELSGKEANLPVLTHQYAHYAARPRINGDDLSRAWIEYLALNNEFPQLTISNFHRPPKNRSDKGDSCSTLINGQLYELIKKQAFEWGCTVANLLLATFHAVLHLYSDEKVILIGYPSANRGSAEFQKLIGFFVNTQVNKTIHSNETTFSNLITQVKEGLRFGMKNEGLPFQALIDNLHPPRIEGVSPIFQAMFVMQNAPQDLSGFPDATIEILNNPSYPVLYDLVLEASEKPGELKLIFEYKTDCLSEEIVKDLSKYYMLLLEDALITPEKAIAELPWQQKIQLPVTHCNLSATDDAETIVDLIREQAEKHPNKLAIISGSESLTYSQLFKKAEEIASALLSLGIQVEEPIGFCLDRGLLFNPTVLGILLAGGAYVPLDPNYPSDRTQWMLDDAGIRTILTHPHYFEKFAAFRGNLIDPFTIDVEISKLPPIHSNQLAYILFTSGSTGRPKGVMIEHRSLLNFTQAAKELFSTSEKDKSLQFASISWDTSNEEIYPCLASGGTLILRSNDPVEPFSNVIDLSLKHEITMWNFPTSYWHDLVSYLINKKISLPKSLRLLIIGGEKVFKEKIEEWISHFGTTVTLLNTYGATEATSISCASNLCEWNREGPDIPIGSTLGNVQAFVLNSAMQPLPIGVSGDLYIGGAGLARGYLNKELNKGKFVQSLYKTGDTAYTDDKGLFFIKGRSDNQIKRRGYRIELEEIQTYLNKIPGVEKSLVILQSSEICAFIVADNLEKDFVTLHLKSHLPGYMYPDKFLFIKDFPRLPNGKINMHELSNLSKNVAADAAFEAHTCTPTEMHLKTIWQEIVGHSHFKLDDSFFDIGGNSLKMITLHQSINDSFEVTTNIADLFRYHTCSSQASMIERELQKHTKPLSTLDLLKQLAEGSIGLETVKSTLNLKD